MKIINIVLVLAAFVLSGCKNDKTDSDLTSMEIGKDYPVYGGNKAGNRYSPLTQINKDNVQNLEPAWTYFANNEPDSTGRSRQGTGEIQCQPIVVNGILYGTSTELNLFALNAATGKQIWKFVPDLDRTNSNRGVMYWEDKNNKRILYTAGSFLFAVDAITGKSIPSFGESGRVDLHEGLSENIGHEVKDLSVKATSPGVIYKNTLIIGSSLSEGGDAAPGHVRGFDVVTGKLTWIFHTIPQPGEEGYETWPKDAYKKFGGANNWSGMSVDEKRGWVFFGTGSASSDYYGGDREGANLFANCVIALEAETGKLKWYFQAIHHDLWDRDFPCPPNLATINHNGKPTDVVVQAGKDGFVYVLNRDNGESIFPIEERPVPTDGVPGEHPYHTQKFVSKPLPLNRQLVTIDDLTDISPEANAFVKKRFLEYPPTTHRYQPPRVEGTLLFGYSGGAEWGGNSIDPEGILYINSNEAPWELTMIDKATRDKENITLSPGHALFNRNCAACHGADRKGHAQVVPSLVDIGKKRTRGDINLIIKSGNARMPAFPYLSNDARNALADFLLNKEPKNKPESKPLNANTPGDTPQVKPDFPYEPNYTLKIWQRFVDQNGYNAVKPPWGSLNAIDLNTGDYLWRVPLGEFPELTKRGIPITGTETYGGPVVTASGLLFIASTRDERIRAFDKKTGKILWEYQLPAGGFSTPITYEVDGKQYIATAVGGGRGAKPGGWYMAFRLK